MADYRPRRSVLYMPAANARALEKAKDIEADALIFDLEDAVAPDAKELAREQACAAAASGDYGRRELTIRCNGLDTPWGADDVRAAAAAAPSAVVIPKVNSAAYIEEVERLLGEAGAPDDTMIWAMVETPTGILNVGDIAHHERVAALVMGTNDMAKEMRATLTPDRAALLPYLAMCLLSAREADITILDGVFNDIKNALTLAEQQAGTLVPRMDHETDDAWFLRERKHQEDLVAARSPVHARIAATTFEIEIHGGFTPYDGSCTQGTVSIDLSPVDFGLYRYALGGRRVDLPLSLDADNVQTAQFKASGSRVFEATSTPVCVSESAAASLTEAGSTLSVTLRRPPDSDQRTGSAEFKNAKTGAKL